MQILIKGLRGEVMDTDNFSMEIGKRVNIRKTRMVTNNKPEKTINKTMMGMDNI
jgi:hypothetical protein